MKLCQHAVVLQTLAAPCDFGQMKSEMMRDHLMSNAHLSAVKDRLLLLDNLTLDKV